MSYPEKQAQHDHFNNPQTQMKNEYELRNAQERERYNAELDRQRRAAQERR